MNRFIEVIVGGEHREAEAIDMRRNNAAALGDSVLIQGVLFDTERLAQAEGRTFQHSFVGGVGALPIGNAARPGELVVRGACNASPKIKNE